jgi:hypothetical protein
MPCAFTIYRVRSLNLSTYVSSIDFVPCENGFVDVRDGGGAAQADEDLRVFVLRKVMIHGNVHLEVLADRADHRLVRGGELPVHSIVKHVEEDDDLVSDADLMITEQLHEELLYPLELSFVIRNLSKEQGTLELLKKFLGFESLAATKFVNILYVGLLSECVLVNIEVHLL